MGATLSICSCGSVLVHLLARYASIMKVRHIATAGDALKCVRARLATTSGCDASPFLLLLLLLHPVGCSYCRVARFSKYTNPTESSLLPFVSTSLASEPVELPPALGSILSLACFDFSGPANLRLDLGFNWRCVQAPRSVRQRTELGNFGPEAGQSVSIHLGSIVEDGGPAVKSFTACEQSNDLQADKLFQARFALEANIN